MERVTERLREIIERAFDSKAEAYSHLELARYFKRRELLPTLIHQREHHIVKGRKGTGKTAMLLYLSLPVQVHCTENLQEQFAGFYLSFGANSAPQISFLPTSEAEVQLLFAHWFNLYACKTIADSIATVTEGGFLKVDREQQSNFARKLWTSFLGISEAAPPSFREISVQLDSFQRELRRFLSATTAERITSVTEYLSKRKKYTGRITNILEFPEVVEIVQTTIEPLSGKVVFILLDEYDNLPEDQQVVVNTAIAGSTGKYFVKVGVLSGKGIKTRNTVTGLTLRDDQLKVVDLEYFANSKEYEKFIRASIEARLGEIQKEVSEMPELFDLFRNLDKLIPSKSLSQQVDEQGSGLMKRASLGQLNLIDIRDKETSRNLYDAATLEAMDIDAWWTLLKNEKVPAYCGIETICSLSSGLIRSAIEIVYRILKDAITNSWDIMQQANCIPYDIQDSAIRREAQYWLKTKLLADIKGRAWNGKELLADVASQLINKLLKQFSYTFINSPNEIALNCFSLREVKDEDADGIKAVKEGMASGIFTQLDESSISPKDAEAYAVHRIYSVRNNLPPFLSGCLRLSWEKFEEYCRRPRGAITKQKDTNVNYFFGIGFRENWENKVRSTLQEKSPPGYRYSDGGGAHEGSILVVGTVEKRIQAARLCIFDITTQNENVLFEYGLAVAKRKPIRHILNRLKAQVTDPKELIPLLRGITLEMYSLSDDASDDELFSLKKATEKAIDWYERVRRRRGHVGNTCSLDDKCRFNPVALNDQIYIAAPQGSMAQRCLSDIYRMIKEDLKLQVYPNITGLGKHYICDFCKGAGRSKYCIVDTTGCEPMYCGVLGLAFGYGRRVLNIYDKNHSGLITNYAGQGPKGYRDKEEIIHEIRSFLQMGEVNEYGKQ